MIAEASHGLVSPEGLAIGAKDVPDVQNTIGNWFEDIGISGSSEENETAYRLQSVTVAWISIRKIRRVVKRILRTERLLIVKHITILAFR